MSDFLTEILAHKRLEVEAAARAVPERTLRERAENAGARRSLYRRLSAPGPGGANIVAEIKRASPSKGKIREGVDPERYARMYEKGGAAAISVLTDEKYFGASAADLGKARAAVEIPVLRKDFLVTSYQVYESAALGADALLLIVRALSPAALTDLIALAESLGMDALVEAHDERELESAASAGARLVGINNRDLKTFRTDIATSINLARRVLPGQALVSESGIHGRGELERLLDAGIFNFLIGESLMRSENPEMALRALRGQKT